MLASEPGPAVLTNMIGTVEELDPALRGELGAALDFINGRATLRTSAKVRWRAQVERAEILLELGR